MPSDVSVSVNTIELGRYHIVSLSFSLAQQVRQPNVPSGGHVLGSGARYTFSNAWLDERCVRREDENEILGVEMRIGKVIEESRGCRCSVTIVWTLLICGAIVGEAGFFHLRTRKCGRFSQPRVTLDCARSK